MGSKTTKFDLISKITQKQIDRYFKQITHLEKTILSKKQQIVTLEKYKHDYNQKKLEPGIKLPLIIKNIYDFLNMIQKSLETIDNEVNALIYQKNKIFEELEKLNVKKEILQQVIDKAKDEQLTLEMKKEQKQLDEIAMQLFLDSDTDH